MINKIIKDYEEIVKDVFSTYHYELANKQNMDKLQKEIQDKLINYYKSIPVIIRDKYEIPIPTITKFRFEEHKGKIVIDFKNPKIGQ